MKFLVTVMEFRIALARPRLLALNVMVPVVLVLAISLGGAPEFHAAAATKLPNRFAIHIEDQRTSTALIHPFSEIEPSVAIVRAGNS